MCQNERSDIRIRVRAWELIHISRIISFTGSCRSCVPSFRQVRPPTVALELPGLLVPFSTFSTCTIVHPPSRLWRQPPELRGTWEGSHSPGGACDWVNCGGIYLFLIYVDRDEYRFDKFVPSPLRGAPLSRGAIRRAGPAIESIGRFFMLYDLWRQRRPAFRQVRPLTAIAELPGLLVPFSSFSTCTIVHPPSRLWRQPPELRGAWEGSLSPGYIFILAALMNLRCTFPIFPKWTPTIPKQRFFILWLPFRSSRLRKTLFL